jgi:hypothetical protein
MRFESAPTLDRDRDYLAQYAFQVGQHLLGRVADDANALRAEPRVAVRIACGAIAAFVCFAVDFDREACGRAVEIEDVLACGVLLAET